MEHFSPKWDSSNSFPQGSKSYERGSEETVEPEGMGDTKATVSSRYKRTGAYMNSQRLGAANTGLTQSHVNMVPVLKNRNGYDFPSLTKKLAPNGILLQRKNQFSLMESYWAC